MSLKEIEKAGGERRPVPEWRSFMTLEDVLVAAVFSPTLSIDPKVNHIVLGLIGEKTLNLLERSFMDRAGVEYYLPFYVTQNHSVINGRLGKGSAGRASVRITLGIDRENQRDRNLATIAHSHGVAIMPQSPTDLEPLFLGKNELDACPLSLVINRLDLRLVFRGKRTPQLSRYQARQQTDGWDKYIRERSGEPGDTNITARKFLLKTTGVNAKWLRQVAREQDLSVFWCKPDSKVANRENLDDLVATYTGLG